MVKGEEYKTLSGPVSHSWTWIFGKFRMKGETIWTGNSIRVFTLKDAKKAKVLLDDRNIIIRILKVNGENAETI